MNVDQTILLQHDAYAVREVSSSMLKASIAGCDDLATQVSAEETLLEARDSLNARLEEIRARKIALTTIPLVA